MQENEYEPLYLKIDGKKYHSTGELAILEGPLPWLEFEKVIGFAPKGNFSITREDKLTESIRCLKSKTGILFAYLLDHRDPNNQMLYRPKRISLNTRMSQRAVIENLRYFEDKEIIARDEESIMVHPGIVHRGNRAREQHLLRVFGDMQSAWRNGKQSWSAKEADEPETKEKE